jgi:hypothetical protein
VRVTSLELPGVTVEAGTGRSDVRRAGSPVGFTVEQRDQCLSWLACSARDLVDQAVGLNCNAQPQLGR